MAVSKRTRYEVLKRDNHTCRYCGATAPDVKLTVDHVTPVALGGTDKPDNLAAACQDCNAGKGSTSPDAVVVAQVSDDALRWAEAIKAASAKMLAEFRTDEERHEWFLLAWKAWDDDLSYLPSDWAGSIDCWVGGGLPQTILLNCLDIAVDNHTVPHRSVFAYMGGVARRRIEDLNEAAQAILGAEGVGPDGA